jgi:hypothetical protein
MRHIEACFARSKSLRSNAGTKPHRVARRDFIILVPNFEEHQDRTSGQIVPRGRIWHFRGPRK